VFGVWCLEFEVEGGGWRVEGGGFGVQDLVFVFTSLERVDEDSKSMRVRIRVTGY
jgi:hypothetical protein